jgi:hypothetical protein
LGYEVVVGTTSCSNLAAPEASNVDTVLVDGRILKRNGKLTAIDAGKLIDEASGTCPADMSLPPGK